MPHGRLKVFFEIRASHIFLQGVMNLIAIGEGIVGLQKTWKYKVTFSIWRKTDNQNKRSGYIVYMIDIYTPGTASFIPENCDGSWKMGLFSGVNVRLVSWRVTMFSSC